MDSTDRTTVGQRGLLLMQGCLPAAWIVHEAILKAVPGTHSDSETGTVYFATGEASNFNASDGQRDKSTVYVRISPGKHYWTRIHPHRIVYYNARNANTLGRSGYQHHSYYSLNEDTTGAKLNHSLTSKMGTMAERESSEGVLAYIYVIHWPR